MIETKILMNFCCRTITSWNFVVAVYLLNSHDIIIFSGYLELHLHLHLQIIFSLKNIKYSAWSCLSIPFITLPQ